MIGRLLLRVILVAVIAAVMPCAVWAQKPAACVTGHDGALVRARGLLLSAVRTSEPLCAPPVRRGWGASLRASRSSRDSVRA